MGMECSVRIPRSWATCDYGVVKEPRKIGFDSKFDTYFMQRNIFAAEI